MTKACRVIIVKYTILVKIVQNIQFVITCLPVVILSYYDNFPSWLALPIIQGKEFKLPPGWLECPKHASQFYDTLLVPIKVPIGAQHRALVPAADSWTPQDVIQTFRNVDNLKIYAVIDLTSSYRYYDSRDFTSKGIKYVKIKCRGHGETPDPAQVNEFVFEASLLQNDIAKEGKERHIICVHCTHGFNRTGFMLTHFVMRSRNQVTVKRALQEFKTDRYPGIYKDGYIEELFEFYREQRPDDFTAPDPPDFKVDENGEANELQDEKMTKREIKVATCSTQISHDDIVGADIHHQEAAMITGWVENAIAQATINRFPGSQPVSFSRQNMDIIACNRYCVTWKADGTRYMILFLRSGAYLIDRGNRVRRVQMRLLLYPPKEGVAEFLPRQEYTLLDGEMVVDKISDTEYKRRFLVYDAIFSHNCNLCNQPFKERYKAIENILKPRDVERKLIGQNKHWYPYQYEREEFSIRRKEFWALPKAQQLLQNFIPQLCHESDGLIFQPEDEQYRCGTDELLLKWKYPHMNSIDFVVEIKHKYQGYEGPLPDDAYVLYVGAPGRQMHRIQDADLPVPGPVRLILPPDVSPDTVLRSIAECSWDSEQLAWSFMRPRTDKTTPNFISSYKKIVGSIQDNITEQVILEVVDNAVKQGFYK